jgi:beta-lactamase regulating signal transducer with metallopeptidase domain
MNAAINSLLERLLATSLQTALLATVVWLLCRLAPRLSPSSQCWLWWLVALQAVLGLVASPVELPLLPYASGVLPETSPAVPWDPAIPAAAISSPSVIPAPGHIGITWQLTAFLLWMVGCLIMVWFTMRDWRRGKALVYRSTTCDDEALLQALAGVARTCGTRHPPELRLSADIESPVLVGHRQPVLLLPATTSMNDEELEMALAHELTHLRRGDLWWGVVPALARHLLFFHPFAHLATREYDIAREAACDADVVDSGQRSRQDYGRLLVRLGAAPASRMGLAVSSPTFQSLQRRLSLLQKTSFLPGPISIALLVVVASTGVLPVRLVAGAAPTIASPTGTSTTIPGTSSQSGEPGAIPRAESLSDEGLDLEQRLELLSRRYELLKTKYEELQSQQLEPTRPADTGAVGRAPHSADSDEDAVLGNRRAEAERRLAEMLLKYKDAHPEVIRLRAQLEELQANDSTKTPDAQDAYKIGRGDSLQISVWNHPELGAELPVRPDGRISTPLVDDVMAVGKTPSQLARDIEIKLKQYVSSPKVVVILKVIGVHSPPGGFQSPER